MRRNVSVSISTITIIVRDRADVSWAKAVPSGSTLLLWGTKSLKWQHNKATETLAAAKRWLPRNIPATNRRRHQIRNALHMCVMDQYGQYLLFLTRSVCSVKICWYWLYSSNTCATALINCIDLFYFMQISPIYTWISILLQHFCCSQKKNGNQTENFDLPIFIHLINRRRFSSIYWSDIYIYTHAYVYIQLKKSYLDTEKVILSLVFEHLLLMFIKLYTSKLKTWELNKNI